VTNSSVLSEDARGPNASLQRQMVFQEDFKIKMSKINEKVDA
jgi:hypothetical protein